MKENSKIHFEALNQSHFELILHWFNKPHVQAFYSLRPWTYEEVCKKLLPNVSQDKNLTSFMIYFENHPVGYIQSYPVKDHPWENQDISEEIVQEASGLDLFIGEEEQLRKGLGKKIIENFLENYIWPSYRYCFVDPDVRNEASIRLFRKCGFIEHKQIDSQNALKENVKLKLMLRKRE